MEGKQLSPSLTRPFFKVLLPGFHQILNLPPAISDELIEERSRRVILQTKMGRWEVKLRMNKETSVMCFKQGWPEFVERHGLKLGEFVFFEDTGDLHLNVAVYKTDFCEKEFIDDDEEEEEEEEEEGTEQSVIPTRKATMAMSAEAAASEGMSCVKTMAPFHGSKYAVVCIPKEFMRSNNIGATQTSVVLIDPKRRRWAVKLGAGEVRYKMRRGWHAFYASNGLKDGDKCVFTVNRPLLTSAIITFDVHIIRAT